MNVLLKENKTIINKWCFNSLLNEKRYNIASAIMALDITNTIIDSYFSDDVNNDSECIKDLYALLQSLFVGIDSLYALALGVTKNKNFININNNKTLRTLRYIRNDVVGHPANRVLNQDALAYCILDVASVSKYEFMYNIYTVDTTTEKTVKTEEITREYLIEANRLLNDIYRMNYQSINLQILRDNIDNVVSSYRSHGDYLAELEKFMVKYRELYPDSLNHRAIHRYELIKKLVSYNNDDIVNYAILLEIKKIYKLVTGSELDIFKERKPKEVIAFYRFMNKNTDLYPELQSILNTDNPMFERSLKKLMSRCKSADALAYLKKVMEIYLNNDNDLLYSIIVIAQEYKLK